jgi:hypothetical protein
VFPRLRLFACLVPGSQSSIAVAHDEIAVTGSVRKRVGFFQKRIWCSRRFRRRGGGIGGEREKGMVVEGVNMATTNTLSTVNARGIRRRGGGGRQSGFQGQQQREQDLVRLYSGNREQRERSRSTSEFVNTKDSCRWKKVSFVMSVIENTSAGLFVAPYEMSGEGGFVFYGVDGSG